MKMTYGTAIRQALYNEMSNDNNVVLFGEDIQKNLYGYTGNLFETFGEKRVINIPLSEASVMGIISGAAMCGLRPILDLTLPNFMYIAMDQIANIVAKSHYMYNGEYNFPLTIFCSSMQGSGNAAQHSDRLHSLFMNIPGLKIICPSTPQDMYSMLRDAIRENNPVLCFADRCLFRQKEDVDLFEAGCIGKAKRVRTGNDVTIVTVSSCLQMVKEILPELEKVNLSVEIIDLRSVNPIDLDCIISSLKKTGRLLVCDTANRTGSVGSEIAALVVEKAFIYLKAPIQIVACEDIPLPFARKLETEVLVTEDKILKKILKMCM